MHIFLNYYFLILCWLNLCFGSNNYDVNGCGIIPEQYISEYKKPKIEQNIEKKIMGGINTKEGEYPFVVAIFYKNEYICTGSLISPRHVLTAAHCFASARIQTFLDKKCGGDQECRQKYLPKDIKKEKCGTGYLGPETIIKEYEIGYGSYLLENVKRVKLESIDPNYQQFYFSGCHQNDLAILTLVKDGNESQRPYVCLPQFTTLNARDDETSFTTLGWGKDPIKRIKRHETLQKLNAGLLGAMRLCLDSWKPFPVDGICVVESEERNSCDGDSGGPLIAVHESRYVLMGLLSFGTDCDQLRKNVKTKTSVFTRLDFYQEKLNDIIGWKNENLDGLDFNGIY